jgi:hypothetical protein
MADENQSDMKEAAEAAADELGETAERVEEAADSAAADATTLADEAVVGYEATVADEAIVTETAVLADTAAGGEEAIQRVEEQVVDPYPETMVAPVSDDQASVPGEELDEEWQMVSAAEAVDAEAVDAEASADEFVVVERTETLVAAPVVTEAVVTEAAAEEPEEALEGFTTLQAVTLAFLVLLNIIVIGLGIWQVSLYLGWL